MEKIRILIGGAGGQGIITFGRILSYAAINKNLEVSCLPAYGAEMRGGYVYCVVTISGNQEIFSPITSMCDIGIFMNEKSYKMLSGYLKNGATVIINSSLVKNFKGKNFNIIEVKATEIAEELGDIKMANMVVAGVIGYILSKTEFKLKIEDFYCGIEKTMKNHELIELAKKVLKEGWKILKI